MHWLNIYQHNPCLDISLHISLEVQLVKRIFSCGKDVIVKTNASFGKGKGISLGDRSQLGVNSFIGEGTKIGNDVIMGPNVTIWTTGHEFSRTDIPINKQGQTPILPVTIGNDVWIGQNVIIKPGAHIGNHVIIGAGSIVTKSFESYAIVGGITAKLIRMRK